MKLEFIMVTQKPTVCQKSGNMLVLNSESLSEKFSPPFFWDKDGIIFTAEGKSLTGDNYCSLLTKHRLKIMEIRGGKFSKGVLSLQLVALQKFNEIRFKIADSLRWALRIIIYF
jgi:hypothetical protein